VLDQISVANIWIGYTTNKPFNNNQTQDELCDQIINSVGQADLNGKKLKEEIKSDVEKSQSNYIGFQNELKKLLSEVEDHRQKVEDALNVLGNSSAKDVVTGYLPIILAIIAIACLASFFGLKLFGDGLQMEWVRSGQLIQFMTVMILLSVIMALGLASILHENTLGTLLGGVAGYVLAQGVGRQAALDATRPTSPPPPPPPPPSSPSSSQSMVPTRSPPTSANSAVDSVAP
jgi:hypothetical protein